MSFTIRQAEIHDVPAILEIVNHAIANTTSIYDYDPRTPEMQQAWLRDKAENKFPVLVAERDASVLGFATYGTFRQKVGYRFTVEHSVYVSPKAKSSGIGTSLMQELIALARSEGYHVMIGVVDAVNRESIGFHAKLGFEPCGTIREVAFKFDRWLDATIMQLRL